jgi:putative DNA primase/helicase
MSLAGVHGKFLLRSGLKAETIEALGFYSVPPAEIDRLSPMLKPCESLLAIPYPNVPGFVRYRVFPPLGGMKYWQPPGSGSHLYIPPFTQEALSNPFVDAVIVESEKAAACLAQHLIAAIGIPGDWCWTDGNGSLHPEFAGTAFVERNIQCVLDSDAWIKEDIAHALYALCKTVQSRGAKVTTPIIPPAPDGSKQGADDFIAANGIEKYQALKRIEPKHPALAQYKSWLENWEKRKTKDAKEIDKLAPRLQPVELWPDPVDGASLLEDIRDSFKRFIVASPDAIVAIALWVLLAHTFDAFTILAMLVFSSPVRQCGKSLSQAIVSKLVPKSLTTSNISPAALFRVIEKFSPTLIVDECDSAFNANPELRELVNASHLRSQAFVCRTVGDNHEPALFCTWGVKCLALIGALPDTTASRSIVIRMQRKTRADQVEKFSAVKSYPDLEILQRKAAKWAADHMAALRQAEPVVLADANDRDQDNWIPLFAIADAVGGEWPKLARDAATKLSGEPDDESRPIELLKDIKTVFDGDPETESDGCDKISSADLIAKLNDMDGRPWADYRRGNGITSNQVARILKPFRIYPRQIRIDAKTLKGYRLEWFSDALSRYLPLYNRNTRNTTYENNDLDENLQPKQNDNVSVAENELSPSATSNVSGVSVVNTPLEGESRKNSVQSPNGAVGESVDEFWARIKAEHAAKKKGLEPKP